MPNEKPKTRPEIMPTLPGTGSCANTTIAGKAEARISPIAIVSGVVQNRLACGSSNVNGSAPRIESEITYLRPNLSPSY